MKYKVRKGCITDTTENTVFPTIIKIGEIIPDKIIENYKSAGSLDNLIAQGIIVQENVDLEEEKKIYTDADKKSKAEEIMEDINKQTKSAKKEEKKD